MAENNPPPPKGPPPAANAGVALPKPVEGWSAFTTDFDGVARWYFVNDQTGESTWTLPDQQPAPPAQVEHLEKWERQQAEFLRKYHSRVRFGGAPSRLEDDPRYKKFAKK